jgi:hypothetical protein
MVESVVATWNPNGNTVNPVVQTVTVNNETLPDVNKFATDCFILQVDNGILKTRQSERIVDGALGSTAEITLSAPEDWYALLFYYVRKGDVIYTNIFLKRNGGQIEDLTTDDKYENIFSYLNEKLEGTVKKVEEQNSSEIAKIKPLSYPKNDYSKELIRIENILIQMYDILLKEVTTMNEKQAAKTTIQGMTAMRQQYAKVEDLCSKFLNIMSELKDKNQENIEQLKRKKKELSENNTTTPTQLKSLHTTFVFNDSTLGSSFYYPPFDLTTNEKFQKLINKYEAIVTEIANKLKDVESTKDFIDESKGNTALMLSKIGKLRSKYAIVIMTLEKLSDKTDNEIKAGVKEFNRDAEKIRKNLEHLISEYGKNISLYTDSNSTIRNALNDFYDYITSTTRMLHDKFKNDISELKLQNRQSDYLSLKPLENISIKPNKTVELTNPHHMNYNSALNTSYAIHYMNEFIKTSVSYESSALPDPANVYKMQKYEVMFPELNKMRNANDNLKYNRDFQHDIGYDNFLYLVEEFMHVFSKIRYHPLIYKLNGLKPQDFNNIFTNTSDFRYISEFDNDSSNKDYDDETELHDTAEADYIKYSTRNKMDFESAVPKTYTSDVDFLRHLTLEMERKKTASFTKMVEELMVDFRKLESENKRLIEVEGEVNNFALSKLDMRNATLEAQKKYSEQRSKNLEIHKNNLILKYRDYLMELEGKLAVYETKIKELDAAGDTEIKANLQIAVNRLEAKKQDVLKRQESAAKNLDSEKSIANESKVLQEMKENPEMTEKDIIEFANDLKADQKNYNTTPDDFKESADTETKSDKYKDEEYKDFIKRIMTLDETDDGKKMGKISNDDGNLYKEKFRSFIPSSLDNRNRFFSDIGDGGSQYTFIKLGSKGDIHELQKKIVEHYIDDSEIGDSLLELTGTQAGGMNDALKEKIREGLRGQLKKCLEDKKKEAASLNEKVAKVSSEKEELANAHVSENQALGDKYATEKQALEQTTSKKISELERKLEEAKIKSESEGKAPDLKSEISRELTVIFNTASAVADAKRVAAEENTKALAAQKESMLKEKEVIKKGFEEKIAEEKKKAEDTIAQIRGEKETADDTIAKKEAEKKTADETIAKIKTERDELAGEMKKFLENKTAPKLSNFNGLAANKEDAKALETLNRRINMFVGGQRGGNIKEYSNYNLKKLKQMYLDTIYPKSDMYCNFVNDLFTTRTNEYSERFVLLLRHLTSESELLKNGKIYFDRYYNFDPTKPKPIPGKDYNPKRRINLFHFVSIIYANYPDYFKRARGIYVKTRFFSSIIRTITQKFQVFQKLIHLFESQEPKFLKRISNLISDNNKDNILSYVKFRSDDPNHYNARFDIYFNRITENTLTDRNNLNGGLRPIQFIYPNENYYDTLFIRYNDDDLKYYTSIKDNKHNSSTDHIHSGKTKRILYDIAPDISGDILTTPKGDNSGRMIYSLKDEIVYALKKKLNTFPNQMYYKNVRNGNLVFPRYDHNYIFGRFTKVFQPKLSNSEIASSMDHVIEQLLMHNPVFIMGYGASGAGKTSTLIYYKGDKTNGIVMDLANILAGKGYTKIILKAEEVYETQQYDINGNVKPDTNNEPIKICSPDTSFVYDGNKGGFVLHQSEYRHQNVHLYRNVSADKDVAVDGTLLSQITKILEDKLNNKSLEKVFQNGASLGDVIIHLVDTDRLVKATTNNVNSSRSHTLVYLTFVKVTPTTPYQYDPNLSIGENIKNSVQTEEDKLELIIGDFAGVENSFNCELPAVVSQFQNIKKEGDSTGKLFYADASTPINKAYDNGEGGAEGKCKEQRGGVGRTVSLTAKGFQEEEHFEAKDIERYIKHLGNPIKLDEENFEFGKLFRKYYSGQKEVVPAIKDKYFGQFDIAKIEEYVTNGKESKPKKELFENLTDYVDINTWDDIDENTSAWQAHLSVMLARIDHNHLLQIPNSMLENITVLPNTEDIRMENFLPKLMERSIYLEQAGAEEIKKKETEIIQKTQEKDKIANLMKTQQDQMSAYSKSMQDINADMTYTSNLLDKNASEIKTINDEVRSIETFITESEFLNSQNENQITELNSKKEQGLQALKKIDMPEMPKFTKSDTSEILQELEHQQVEAKQKLDALSAEIGSLTSEIENLPRRIQSRRVDVSMINNQQTSINKVDYAYPIRGLYQGYYNKANNEKYKSKQVFRTYNSGFKMLTNKIDTLIEKYNVCLEQTRDEISSKKNDHYKNIAEGANTIKSPYNDSPYLLNDINFFKTVLSDINTKINSKNSDLREFDDTYTPAHFIFYLSTMTIILECIKEEDPLVFNPGTPTAESYFQDTNKEIYFCNVWYNKKPIHFLKLAVKGWYENVAPHIKKMMDPENKNALEANKALIRELKQNTIQLDLGTFNAEQLSQAVNEEIKLKTKELEAKMLEKNSIEHELNQIKDAYIPAVNIMKENNIDTLESSSFTDILSAHYSSVIEDTQKNKKDTTEENRRLEELSNNLSKITEEQNVLEQKNTTNAEKLMETEKVRKPLVDSIAELEGKLSEQVNEIKILETQKKDLLSSIKPKTSSGGGIKITPTKKQIEEFQSIYEKMKPPHKDDYNRAYAQVQYIAALMVDMISMARFHYVYMQQICKNRLKEGMFINKSLRDMRNTFKDMIAAKNSDTIDVIPNFVDVCMKSYCSKYENCFETSENTIPNYNKISSYLINSIYEKLGYNKSENEPNSIEKFYKKLQVCAFCVVNISINETANNPPPSPYIDINKLKTLFYNHKNIIFGEPTDLSFNFVNKNSVEGDETDAPISEKSKRSPIKETRKLFKEECLSIINIIRFKYTESQRGPFVKNVHADPVFQNFESFAEDFFKSDEETGKNTTYNINKTPAYVNIVANFLEFMDNLNATSTIGTLEFMDAFAKYNQTKVLCKLPDDGPPTKYNMVDMKNAVLLQNEALKNEAAYQFSH